uniref:Hyperglycemic hormone n=1 Tax=Chaceon quinquedens TaxID=198537 RepID=A0A6B7FMK0_CHAQN|nr:hyperglycemic hormone [Chaceon quinquedens]
MMAVLVMVCVFMYTLPNAHARSAQGLRMERLLASLRGPSDTASPLGDFSGSSNQGSSSHPLEKRQIYDTSCKGVYDRGLFSDLEHVCDDCYNLYRTSYVASACRSDCYSNLVFRQCMNDLLLMEDFDQYAGRVQMVGRKK